MPVCSNAEPPATHPRQRGRSALVLLGLLALSLAVQAAQVLIERAALGAVNDVYVVDADVAFSPGEKIRQALRNGIALTLVVEAELQRQRAYLWDPTAARAEQRHRVEQHALSGQFVVTNALTGSRRAYLRLDDALAAIGQVRQLPLIERGRLQGNGRYRARLRAYLDIDELPALLRPLAYVMPSWRMSSGWYSWELDS